jgi:MoxR-like ATPase
MEATGFYQSVRENVQQAIIGKDDAIQLLVIALLCEGHILLEDVPGIGKTTLAKALARTLNCTFARIQFTPDLLPSDVTGINFYNQKQQEFEFRRGPIFSQILLADEINRATPRTQSSLLEAMQERQATIDGETHRLDRPFMVIATQNPIELEGTFPLPEAQLDRFMLQVQLGYPTLAEEEDLLLRYQRQDPMEALQPIISAADILALQSQVREVHISEPVRGYILSIVRQTREHPVVQLGVSPRGSMALYRASQAMAALQGRDFVTPTDVQTLCPSLLTHRIHISAQTRLRGRTAAEVVAEIADSIPVPVME